MLLRKASRDDAAAIARVNVDTWRSAFAGIISDSYLANLSYEGREQDFKELLGQSEELSFAYVVENQQGEIIGFAIGGKDREGISPQGGEIYALYVSEAWQKQGVGRMLVQAAANHLYQLKVPSLVLWTLAAGSANGFYKTMGGDLIIMKVFTIADQDVVFAVYGWDNIHTLLGNYFPNSPVKLDTCPNKEG